MKYFLISIFGFAICLTFISSINACEDKGRLKNSTFLQIQKTACHEFTFDSATATYVEISARQKGVDVELRLFENGTEINHIDSENLNSGYEFLTFIAKPDARYSIRVNRLDDEVNYFSNEGVYSLEVENRNPADADKDFIAKLEEAGAFYSKATGERHKKNANAVNDYLSAISIYKSLPPNKITKYNIFLARYFLGVSYNLLKKYNEAIPFLEAAALAAEDQDEYLENLTFNELGIACLNTESFQKAAEALAKAASGFEKLAAEKIGSYQSLPSVYLTQAELSLSTNNTENAIRLLENIRSNFKKPPTENTLASLRLADVYFNLGNPKKTEEILLTINIADDMPNFIKGIYYKISGKLFMKSDKEKALSNLNRANFYLSGNDAELNETGLFIGNAYFYAKDFDSAKSFYEQSKQFFELQNKKENLAQALNNLGVISYRKKDISTAITNCEYALSLNLELKNETDKARNLINLMYFYNDLKNPPTAIFYGKWAINTIQSIKYDQIGNLESEVRENFQDSFNDAFRKLSELLISEGRIGEAEQVLRFIKEKEYRDYVRGGEKISGIDFNDREKEMLEKAKNNRQKKFTPTDDRTVEVDSSASPTKQLIYDLKKQQTNVAELLFVTAIAGQNKVNLIVTSEKNQKVYTATIDRENLSKLVFQFREAVTNIDKNPRPEAEKLYDILVKPFEKDFLSPDVKKIVWSLDGVLRYVPIPALFDGKNYLVERVANIQLPLASEEKILKPKSDNLPAIGLASSKSFENLSDLPVAKNELDCIFEDGKKLIINSSCQKGIIKGKKVADENFTREVFENALKEFGLIHLTSHFVLQSGDNSKSYLLLGGGNDRKYTMKTFAGQQLENVDTLIMSACDTANFSYDGSEFESFATMAQKQGAGAVVGTLWSVADYSTSKLMTEFYRSYEIKKQDKAAALQNSQMLLLKSKKHSHPFYWASFVLFGNWK